MLVSSALPYVDGPTPSRSSSNIRREYRRGTILRLRVGRPIVTLNASINTPLHPTSSSLRTGYHCTRRIDCLLMARRLNITTAVNVHAGDSIC